jgi:capsule polysaccharide export protein KpsE/RkpR
MPSQLELLQESLARLEPEYGPENPFVKGLKTQIAGLENQQYRAQERERFNLAVTSSSNQGSEPEPEDIAAFNLYEKRVAEISKGENGKGELE